MKLLLIVATTIFLVLVSPNISHASDLDVELLWKIPVGTGCVDSFTRFNKKYRVLINEFGGKSFDRSDIDNKICEEMYQKYVNVSQILTDVVASNFLNNQKAKVIVLVHKAMINAKVVNVYDINTIIINANHPDMSSIEELKIVLFHEWQHVVNMLQNVSEENFASIAVDEGSAVKNSMVFMPSVKISKLLMMSDKNLNLCIKKINKMNDLSDIWSTSDIEILKEWFVGNTSCERSGCRCGYLVGFCDVVPTHEVCNKLFK